MADVQINDKLFIPESCLQFQASRSSGPGGQHVNKLNTRITLIFDLPNCPTLSDAHKQRLVKALAAWADREGRLHIASQRYRSQQANRQDALERLKTQMALALRPRLKRRKTAIPARAVEQRLERKKRHATIKKLRMPIKQDKE